MRPTGETCRATARYSCEICGAQSQYKIGEILPPCGTCARPTRWVFVSSEFIPGRDIQKISVSSQDPTKDARSAS